MSLKDPLKRLIGSAVRPRVAERLHGASVLEARFRNDLKSAARHETRHNLWQAMFGNRDKDKPVLVIEFGVYQGESLRSLASLLTNPDSRFLGLDSFRGLPERWWRMPAGTFSTNGQVPLVDDERVDFLPGLFTATAGSLETRCARFFERNPTAELLVHYDADLFSSTLFALTTIARIRPSHAFVFDEFWSEEALALSTFCDAFGASAVVEAFTSRGSGIPSQVGGRLSLQA